MFKYKLCLCDMDGTLLDSKGVISEENEKALKRLEKNGVEIVIASGRVDLMVKNFIKQLGLEGHVISCNGGLIRNITTGEIIYSKLIDKDRVRKIIKYSLDNKIQFLLYTTDIVYSSLNNPISKRYERLNEEFSEEELKIPIEYIDDTIIENMDNIDVLKVLLICGSHGEVEPLEKYFSKFEDLTVVSSASGLLDIMASNITKGNGLKILCDKLGIELNETIAFGDNYNDIEMLQYAGLSIAMENAVDDVKLIAKYITKSNNESGIAYAINNMIFPG